MASWADVRSILRAFPEIVEQPERQWRVKKGLVAWERPLRRSDLQALGDRAPRGDILGVRVPSLEAKDALLASRPRIYFTTPHFDGYPAVLVRLGVIGRAALAELLEVAWLDRAPVRARRAFEEAKTKPRPKRRPAR